MSEILKIEYHPKLGLLGGIYEKQTRKVQKHTLLDISYYTKDAEGQKLSFVSLASYIIGAKNMSEGYCLISPMNITEFMTDPLVQSIQALPEKAYLSNKIVNPHPHLLSLRFYEQEHPDFIERYGILSYLNKEHNTWEHFLLLDAYYPKNLEAALEQDTLQAINTFVHKYATLADAIEKYYGG
ncbi:MAG: hypothetical protein IGS03_13880 [Candidatus Sericytochromatia bacterium]|nr:hypothetical protein [Candidatus Sericytochromatia bacterium]